MVTVRISDQSDLQLPRQLSDGLCLSDGDQVALVRRGDLVILQKTDESGRARSFQELAGLVEPSRALSRLPRPIDPDPRSWPDAYASGRRAPAGRRRPVATL